MTAWKSVCWHLSFKMESCWRQDHPLHSPKSSFTYSRATWMMGQSAPPAQLLHVCSQHRAGQRYWNALLLLLTGIWAGWRSELIGNSPRSVRGRGKSCTSGTDLQKKPLGSWTAFRRALPAGAGSIILPLHSALGRLLLEPWVRRESSKGPLRLLKDWSIFRRSSWRKWDCSAWRGEGSRSAVLSIYKNLMGVQEAK